MANSDLQAHDRYLVRRKVFTILGAAFHVYGPNDELLLYSRQKAFRLKEDLRLYTDESKTTEVLRIAARQVIDFGATYDVIDSATNAAVGSLRRKGLASMVRDQWLLLDAEGREFATLVEDSTGLALLRRFVELAATLFPQKHHIEMGGQTVASFQQRFNPFILKIDVDLSADPQRRLDRRLALAAAILLCAIEGRQK
jgi:hypothetical protein